MDAEPSPVLTVSDPRSGTDIPGPRVWDVHEQIGDFEELLGTVTAVHQPNAMARAVTQFRIFDSIRMTRIRLEPHR